MSVNPQLHKTHIIRDDDRHFSSPNRIQYEMHHNGIPVKLRCDFRLYGLNRTQQRPIYYHPSPAHTRLFLFEKGGCVVETAEGKTTMQEGVIYLIPTAQPFKVKYDIQEFYFAHLDVVDGTGLSVTNEIKGIPALADSTPLRDNLVSAWQDGNTHEFELTCFRALLSFLSPVMDQLCERSSKYNPFVGITEEILQHIREPIKVADLARKMHMDRSVLSRSFRKATGITLKDYILNAKLEETKRLLTLSELSTEEIAAAVGYEDTPYFYRLFRKRIGMTPGEFKQIAHDLIL